MFQDRVIAHYVRRGYTVEREQVLVGASGGSHRVDLAVSGPLGDLVVYFGEDEPFQGPELASIRRSAKDLGAGAVVAVPQATARLRDAARQTGVILLDDAGMADGPAPVPDLDVLDTHWPEPPALRVDDLPDAPAAAWPLDDGPAPRPEALFSWLPEVKDGSPVLPDDGRLRPVPHVEGVRETDRDGFPLHWVWGPLLYAAVTVLALALAAALFL